MRKITFIVCAGLIFGLWSCDGKTKENGNEPAGTDPVEFSVTASTPSFTGSSGLDIKWSADDAIGLFDNVKASSNKKFTLETGAGQASGTFKGELEDNDAVSRTIYAITPFVPSSSTAAAEAYPLALDNNQTSMNKYLFAAASATLTSAPSESAVNLSFKSLMSVLKISITGIGATGSTLNSVRLQAKETGVTPFATKATVDLTASAPAAFGFSNMVAGINVGAPVGISDSYEAGIVLFPTDFSNAAQDLQIIVLLDNGQTFTFDLEGFDKNLAAGTVAEETVELIRSGEGGFEFAAGETARPGTGEYANMDIVPIRGEILNSTSDLTPYTFTIGKTAGNGRQLRIWWISKKDTDIGLYFALNRFGENNDIMGFDPNGVAETGGAGSYFAGGNASKSWKETMHYFKDGGDAANYNVSYTQYNVNNNSKFMAPSKETFTIYGMLGNTAVNEENQANKIPYADMRFPVTINVQEDTSDLEVFTPSAGETARPGIGDFADYDVIAVRGEFINSNAGADNSLYYPSSGQAFAAGKGFRIWFIAKKDYAGGDMLKLAHDNRATYFKGTKVAEVTTICGANSEVGGGNANKSYKENPATFASVADNSQYTISYARWNVDQTCIITGPAGDYTVPFYIVTSGVSNAISKDLTCDVKIKVIE